MAEAIKRYAARIRGLAVPVGLLLIVGGLITDLGWLGVAGIVAIIAGVILYFVRTERPDARPIPVTPPVQGRWIAVNSPADRVPSHGTRELGQAYAIDLVHVPDPAVPWQGVHAWPPARRPRTFPGFGAPVRAPADGTVVAASGWQRDHLSRNSPLGLLYLIPEMVLRGLLSPASGRFVLGNHIIIDLGDRVYAVLAHLRRGSLRVRPGQRVAAGEQVADCGNSGNSSEPHLHFHLMDRRWPAIAVGLPFSFERYLLGDAPQSGVPRNQQPFTSG